MEDFLRACHAAVKESGAEELAGKMCLAHVSLLQRSNPDNAAHHLTIEHLFGILLHTGDMRPLAALADQFGFELVAKSAPAPKVLTSSLLHVSKEIADLTLAVHSALADNHVSQIEKQAIRKEIDHVRHELNVMEESVKVA
ncbi:Rha family transcriptional regulator [Pseudomonas sp. GD03842]|uniref:phage regulatory CII family protein n=1 Tax=Pseudomonas sp. GD03842 TaxID=2975385 RepID=UPI00244AE9B7|nr:phage regulatory CII family protein [Pseudomonas sp. GD03842]MDH0745261.1 Rha family transcriptional regulator [Pseudomonas sp. GD03842]